MGGRVLANLQRAGYPGHIIAVNRKGYATVAGVPCVRQLTADTRVDLAVLCLPAKNLYTALRDAAAAGVRAALVLTGGMARDQLTDTAMHRLKLVARRRGVRLLGPNSLGLIVPAAHLNLSYSHVDPLPGNIAYVGMSSALGSALLDWATGRGYGFSHFVTVGARADISISDVVDYLANDRRVKAILLHVEVIRNAARFMTVLRAASKTKKVVVLNTDTETPAPDGLPDRRPVIDAYFARTGAVSTDSFQDLIGTVQTLVRARQLFAHRLALVSNGLGPALLARYAFERHKGELVALGRLPESLRAESLHQDRAHDRFLIVPAGVTGERLHETLTEIDRIPGIGASLVLLVPNIGVDQASVTRSLINHQRRSRRTLMVVWLGEATVQASRQALDAANVLQFESVESAIDAFATLIRHERVQQNLRATPAATSRVRPDRRVLDKLAEEIRYGEKPWVGWDQTRSLLALFDFTLNPASDILSPSALNRAAAEFRYPVSLRLLHEHYMVPFAYRSDPRRRWRGVAVDVKTPEELRAHASRLMSEHVDRFSDSPLLGFTVQPMRRRLDSLQFSLGITRDRTFGPLILFGLGGSWANVLADRQLALPPLNRTQARLLIGSAHVFQLLQERCSAPAAAEDALLDAVMRLSELAESCHWLAGLELNLVLENDDELIVLGAAAVHGSDMPPVIATYPADWERTIELSGGESWVLRPVRAEDEPGLRDLYERQPPEALRLRFFGSRLQFEHRELATLCQVDYRREMAFVLAGPNGRLYGEVRGWTRVDAQSMEFAILLDAKARGHGLARTMLNHLEAYAAASHLASMSADILPENQPMRRLAQRLGYQESTGPDGSLTVVKRLNAVRTE